MGIGSGTTAADAVIRMVTGTVAAVAAVAAAAAAAAAATARKKKKAWLTRKYVIIAEC